MWKFSSTLIVIAVSTSVIVADEGFYCQEAIHKICTFFDILLFVNQTRCINDSNDIISYWDCKRYLEPKLPINVENFSIIAPHAFESNTNYTEFIMHIGSMACVQKIIHVSQASFDGLLSVKKLTIDCLQFTPTPNVFKNLASVDEIKILRTKFTYLSENLFSEFPKLRKLDLRRMNITTITPDTFSNISHELQHIELLFNNLRVIEDKSFQKFYNLTTIVIEDNDLTDLRLNMFNGLDALKICNLKGNKISQIQVGTPFVLSIQHLDLSDNKLENLPVGLFNYFPYLKFLSLKNNKMNVLHRTFFEGLYTAIELDLSHNNLRNIESTTFWDVYLKYLRLSHNQLSVLEPDTFNGLYIDNDLYLDCNDINVKEQVFRNFRAKSLILSRRITELEKLAWGVHHSVKIHIKKNPCNSIDGGHWI